MGRVIPEVDPPSIAEAMTDVVDAGERLVSHRLELAIVELRKAVERLQQMVQLGVAALLLAGTGWIFAMMALLSWLAELLGSRALAAAIIAALQLGLAAALILSRRRLVKGG